VIIAVTGTGTGVGKTTVSVALVHALRERGATLAYKPIETGGDDDGRALATASGSDAGPTVLLKTPVAPNVAARIEGVAIDLAALARSAWERARSARFLVLETPGGLFSPVADDGTTNADWLDRVEPDRMVVVASNRLGVLHDVEAVRRASRRTIDVVVLTGAANDASVATNATELRRQLPVVEMRALADLAQLRAWAASL
jgi:dethiobiotin synthase